MSHNISKVNGIDEVFVAGKPAWHGLGNNVDKAQSWKKAVQLAHLEWKVNKEFLFDKDGKKVDAYGLFRSDTGDFINSVGSQFMPFQNEDCFSWVDTLLSKKNGAHYVTAGALGKGEIVWCLAKLPEKIGIKGTDDISENYLLFVDYRIQGKAAINKLTNTRVVCNNTLNIALKDNGALLRIRHNEDFNSRLETAKTILAGVRGDIMTLDDKLNFLASKLVTKDTLTKYFEYIFPNIKESTIQQNRAERILELYESNDNNAIPEIRGSAYNLLNSVTNYIDHEASVTIRNQDGTGAGQLVQAREARRAETAMFGAGSEFKTDSLNWIFDNVQMNPSMPKGIGNPKVLVNILDKMDLTLPIGK